jgi:hypothetical protein
MNVRPLQATQCCIMADAGRALEPLLECSNCDSCSVCSECHAQWRHAETVCTVGWIFFKLSCLEPVVRPDITSLCEIVSYIHGRIQEISCCILLYLRNKLQIIILKVYVNCLKWSSPRNRLWGPVGLWDVEDPTLSRRSAHGWRQGCQPYSPATPYSPRNIIFLLLNLSEI